METKLKYIDVLFVSKYACARGYLYGGAAQNPEAIDASIAGRQWLTAMSPGIDASIAGQQQWPTAMSPVIDASIAGQQQWATAMSPGNKL